MLPLASKVEVAVRPGGGYKQTPPKSGKLANWRYSQRVGALTAVAVRANVFHKPAAFVIDHENESLRCCG